MRNWNCTLIRFRQGGARRLIRKGITFSLRISSLLGAGEMEPVGVVAIEKCPALYIITDVELTAWEGELMLSPHVCDSQSETKSSVQERRKIRGRWRRARGLWLAGQRHPPHLIFHHLQRCRSVWLCRADRWHVLTGHVQPEPSRGFSSRGKINFSF